MNPWAVLQHVPWEGPGLIAHAARDGGASLDVRRLDLGEVGETLAAAWAEHLPPSVTIDRERRRKVERAGRSPLGRFFSAATARQQGETS